MDTKDESLRNAIAKTIYDTQVESAVAAVEATRFSASGMHELFSRLLRESETAQILIFYSYLDDRIQNLITSSLFHLDSKRRIENVFGINGPLSTFSSRVLLAFHLGWLQPTTKQKLDAFRKLRNAFAHNAFRISTKDKEIAALLEMISMGLKAMFENSAIGKDGIYDFSRLDSLLGNLSYLAFTTFHDLLVLPAARAFRVAPGDVSQNYDKGPKIVQELRLSFADTILVVMKG